MNMRKHWWGCVYDQFENDTKDVKLLLDLIGEQSQNLFEVCCGTGRALVPLAQAGHTATGIDIDEGMLARIPAKAQGLHNLTYTHADALTTDWGSGYDVVVLGDNTLMNITNREDDKAAQMLLIEKASDALKVGGHFFLTFDNYPAPEEIFNSNNNGTINYKGTDDAGVYGEIYNYGGRYNPITRIATWNLHAELTTPDGAKHIVPEFGYKYVCTREEVHGWLANAGFVIEHEYGDCNRAPFEGKQGWDIIWARKVRDRALTPEQEEIKGHWYAYIYEQQVIQAEEVEFMQKTIGSEPRNVLEVACGGGRILAPLAKAGHTVTGFDIDKYMLERCKMKIAGMDNASCHYANALLDDWGSGYDAVVLAGNILINIVTDADYAEAQQLFIQKAAAALKQGGHLHLDFGCHKRTNPVSDGEWTVFEGVDDRGTYGKFIVVGGEYDVISQRDKRSSRRYEITPASGNTFTYSFENLKHYPTLAQAHAWLADAGFAIERECGG